MSIENKQAWEGNLIRTWKTIECAKHYVLAFLYGIRVNSEMTHVSDHFTVEF